MTRRLRILTNAEQVELAGLRSVRDRSRAKIYLDGIERLTRENHWLDPRDPELIADHITKEFVPSGMPDIFHIVADTLDLSAGSLAYPTLHEMISLGLIHVQSITHNLSEGMVERAS